MKKYTNVTVLFVYDLTEQFVHPDERRVHRYVGSLPIGWVVFVIVISPLNHGNEFFFRATLLILLINSETVAVPASHGRFQIEITTLL